MDTHKEWAKLNTLVIWCALKFWSFKRQMIGGIILTSLFYGLIGFS